ncbi:MAG: tRNA (guanine(46)-N(7))-methyltransferase TrmB [Calditrichia bacterium]
MLGEHFLNWGIVAQEQDGYPIDWQHIFGRIAPIGIEIGFGNGEYLLEWSRRQPDWNLIGMEVSLESMERCQMRMRKHQVQHARPLYCDARFGLKEFFAPESIDHVVMNYPDPWPKRRHDNRRLISGNFPDVLASGLKTGCFYELVTDQEFYVREAAERFADSPFFDTSPVERNPERSVKTKYERKWDEMGRDCFRLLARKIKQSSPNRLLENSEMPHTFLTREPELMLVRKLQDFTHRDKHGLVTVKQIFKNTEQDGYLLKVVAKDIDYKQSFFVLIKPHEDGRWIVKLDQGALPYRTPAVKMAVWEIGNALVESLS